MVTDSRSLLLEPNVFPMNLLQVSNISGFPVESLQFYRYNENILKNKECPHDQDLFR